MRRKLLLVMGFIAAGVLVGPLASQDGAGVIVEGNPRGAENIGSLHPLRCNNPNCRRVVDLLYPTLLAVDPAASAYAPSSGDDTALATGWHVSDDGTVYTFDLRDDLYWSDGAPVTAYDVFFTHLDTYIGYSETAQSPFRQRNLRAVVPLDAQTIAFVLAEPSCEALHLLNTSLLPVHDFQPDFAEATSAALPEGDDLLARFQGWEAQAGRDYHALISAKQPSVTAGTFVLQDIRPTEYVRLITPDGRVAFDYVDAPDINQQVDWFIEGRLNLLVNPPVERLADLRAVPDAQVVQTVSQSWEYISLNLAAPGNSQNAFDEDGIPLEQGAHPLFGDVRVRRALQMALDVPTIIEAALQGAGAVMPANMRPGTWAYNPELAPIAYDPAEAGRLLDEAGWRDWNGDGIRECHDCLHAGTASNFGFELLYNASSKHQSIAANLVRQQLRQVGADVYLNGQDADSLMAIARSQRYDAYLGSWHDPYPLSPDQAALFTRSGDVLSAGSNTGSYHNPQVERLMQQALTLPGCDQAARAEIYQQLQPILQADQPYLWLYSPYDTVAVRGVVRGFAPYPGAPLWNMADWVIQQRRDE